MNSHASAEAVPEPSRSETGHLPPQVTHAQRAGQHILPDDALLRICQVSESDLGCAPDWVAGLHRVALLAVQERRQFHLEAALALLASSLGALEQFSPAPPPSGHAGPHLACRGWVDRETLERIGKQIVGCVREHASVDRVALAVQYAVDQAIHLGFLEQRLHDAWRPGMASGSGLRWAVTATHYGITRAGVLVQHLQKQRQPEPTPPPDLSADSENPPGSTPAPEQADKREIDPLAPPRIHGSTETRPFRERLLALCTERGLTAAEPAAGGRPSVAQVAAQLADELDAWVEALRACGADCHPAGGYWTTLGDELRDMLGPAELASDVIEDAWTPLLTQLRMCGLADLAKSLERLAGDVLPQAQVLARDIDAVAYLRNGGPRDAFYTLYAADDLVTHETSMRLGRQNVSRGVRQIISMLRTLASAQGHGRIAAPALTTRNSRPQPRRGTRAANIEKLERELEMHLLAARDHAHSLRDRGREPALLPRPSQKELARRMGLTEPDVSRCLNDSHAKFLRILWESADSLERVMKYKWRR